MSDDVHLTGTVTVPYTWTTPSESIVSSQYTIDPNRVHSFRMPKYTWKVVIGHNESHGITIGYTDEQLPCWFHRKMQELILGFKWSKL